MHAGVNCVCNVCGSTHSRGCVVNGTFAGQPLSIYCGMFIEKYAYDKFHLY